MLLFSGIATLPPPLQPPNANVSRWTSEYVKVLARRSASRILEAKQAEAQEPNVTADNDAKIITLATRQRVEAQEPTVTADSDVEIITPPRKKPVEATASTATASNGVDTITSASNQQVGATEPVATGGNDVDIVTSAELPMLDFEDVNMIMDADEDLMDDGMVGEALRKPIFIDLTSKKRPRITTSNKRNRNAPDFQIGEGNNHKTQSTDEPAAPSEPPTFAPPRRVSKSYADSVFKERHVIQTVDSPRRRPSQQINRAHLQELNIVKLHIQKIIKTSTTGQGDLTHDHATLRNHIQKLEYFEEVSELLLDRSHILKEEGLPRIYSCKNKLHFPQDIIVDAKRLARRWEAGQFDASIDRGIKHEKLSLGQGKTRWAHNLKIEESDHRDAHVQGHNGLDVGQWWFSRLAVLRDGAHGEIEAGIFGVANALAIALSGKGYANVDMGDEIYYVGTPGEKGEPSRGTKLLESSLLNKNPIRVLRSVNKDSKYAPKAGFRYDGLYQIVSKKSLDPERFLNSYLLQRLPRQAPIRYEGPAIRPSAWELHLMEVLKSRFN
ncbi:ydg sra domain-containing protein [Rutstroemia sp. NJR-2017a WRK4]|nr:ydg sra domain-containing protein [Rutstroemia sp. NJR-2017a WRK4]